MRSARDAPGMQTVPGGQWALGTGCSGDLGTVCILPRDLIDSFAAASLAPQSSKRKLYNAKMMRGAHLDGLLAR